MSPAPASAQAVQGAAQSLRQHGYTPAPAAATGAATVTVGGGAQAPSAGPNRPLAPVIGTSWQGTSQSNLTPPDGNGAIGPNSYVETVNTRLAIYSRAG